MLIAYSRVSTDDQSTALQREALERVGCERFFEDTISGAKSDRPGLRAALDFARPGDVLVVWKLDRLGRSLPDLIECVETMKAREIGFRSLQESFDTTTANGILFFHVFGAIAQFERELIRERTNAGLESARARGVIGERPRALDEKKRALAQTMYNDAGNDVKDICATLGISRATLYRYVTGPTGTTRDVPRGSRP